MGLKMFPQLRIKSEYSFKRSFGTVKEIAEILKERETPFAALVDDSGTWGHVAWEKAFKNSDVAVGFGREIPIYTETEEKKLYTPKAWVLAKDIKKFYELSTFCEKQGGLSLDDFKNATGVVRFASFALDDPDTFDYIDINPKSKLANYHAFQLHKKTGKPMVFTSNNETLNQESLRYSKVFGIGSKLSNTTILCENDIYRCFDYLDQADIKKIITTTYDLAAELKSITLPKADIIHVAGSLKDLCEQGVRKRVSEGFIKDFDEVYQARLERELKTIEEKDFSSYFLVVADMVTWAKKHMLVGPGRGSAAGSLVCYVLGITEIDPIQYNLIFERFIDASRDDFPDIDVDFNDEKRYMVIEYLKEKYGANNVARVGSIALFKPDLTIREICKAMDVSIDDYKGLKTSVEKFAQGNELFGHSLETALETEQGRIFKEKHSLTAEILTKWENRIIQSGTHAAGVLVSNDRVDNYCTIGADGTAHIDKYDAEYLNLLKIDALSLKNLRILENAKVIKNEDFYKIKFDDQSVLDIINDNKMIGIFQFEGATVRKEANKIHLTSFEHIDHLTSLARPGPLGSGMTALYTERAQNKAPVTFETPALEKILKSTYGLMIYQEQVMFIVREIGGLDWGKTNKIRKLIAKSQGGEALDKYRDDFITGAKNNGLTEEAARNIWHNILSFGGYGFNRSHSVSYAAVTYWTCFIKKHYPLDFALSCLISSQGDKEKTKSLLKELEQEGVKYIPFDIDHSLENWSIFEDKILGGFLNLDGIGEKKASFYIQKRKDGTLTDEDRVKILKLKNNYQYLYSCHEMFGHYYDDPSLLGVRSGKPIKDITKILSDEDALCIFETAKIEVLSENSADRIKKRGGKSWRGQDTFVDLSVLDDSLDKPVKMRIKTEDYYQLGKSIVEEDKKGSFYLARVRRYKDFDFYFIKNIKKIL